ncbi:MAG: pyruvate carboxyltransferase [Bacillota bacterium]
MNKFVLPSSVVLGDITVRDGFQHEERFVPTETKQWFILKLQEAGFKRIEVTNFGNPTRMPQFKDREELLKGVRRLSDVQYTAVTISERSIKEAIEAKQEGWGVDRVLIMISTSERHNLVNAGLTHAEHWARLPHWIRWVHDAGMSICGTVSTIWGCPIAGPMPMSKAIEFTKRMLDLGIDDIEHADHDGQATPDKVYDYFSQVLDAIPDPRLHIAHFHVTRGWGLANVFAALQAGVTHFESTVGGIGGQPANLVDGVPVLGTGRYYSRDPGVTGLVCT